MTTLTKHKMKYDKCLGSWENPYKNTKGILSFDIYKKEDKTFIRVRGIAGGMLPGDWGEAELTGYAHGPEDNQAAAFKAFFDLGFSDVLLAINENKGLLVILAYINPKAGSSQSEYFIREFYCRK